MLRILGAIHTRGRVLVLNDPFETMHGQWRERYAEAVVYFARSTKSIVVVTALSSRPECWIDNELIVRVQVGETRQKTIGFSSAPSELRSEIAQLREELLQRPQAQPTGPLTAVAAAPAAAPSGKPLIPDASPPLSSSLREQIWKVLRTPIPMSPLTVFLIFGVVAIAFVYKYVAYREDLNSKVALAAQATPDPTLPPEAAATPLTALPVEAKPTSAHALATPVAVPMPAEQPHEATVAVPESGGTSALLSAGLLLDRYPFEVKRAVIRAFEGSELPIPAAAVEGPRERAPSEVNRRSADILKMLEAASDTGAKSPDTAQPIDAGVPAPEEQPDVNEMSWEQRRELMRQRFLESIQAASQE